jgi:hypothetical protein
VDVNDLDVLPKEIALEVEKYFITSTSRRNLNRRMIFNDNIVFHWCLTPDINEFHIKFQITYKLIQKAGYTMKLEWT